MFFLFTLSCLVLLIHGVNVNKTIQTNDYEENITQKTKLRDILHLWNTTVHDSKRHTVCYVPDIFSAVNLFPVETSQDDAAQW